MSNQFFTIKTPEGRLVASCARSSRWEALDDFIDGMIRQGCMKDRPDWYGPSYAWRYWRRLRKTGYSFVRISVREVVDEATGWTIPELTEVPA